MTTTIEAGRWYRRRSDGLVVRADRPMGGPVGAVGWWALTPGDVGRHAVYRADLEPWVPRVGEWVRWPDAEDDDCRQPWLVERIDGPVTRLDLARFVGRDAAGEKCEHDAHEAPCRLEPCAPPAIEALPPSSPEHLAEWAACGSLSAPTPPRRDDGTRCPRCGGPAYMGLGLTPPECVAPRCEPVTREPTVREALHDPAWEPCPQGEWDHDRYNDWQAARERVWEASGCGHKVTHPIRSEAVRLWREAGIAEAIAAIRPLGDE